jgi:hypothetical protein
MENNRRIPPPYQDTISFCDAQPKMVPAEFVFKTPAQSDNRLVAQPVPFNLPVCRPTSNP